MSRNKTADEHRFAQMLGTNMKYLRLKKQFSPMKVLAHYLGMTHQQIAKYESGKNIPCAYRLTQIADYYKVKTDDLINPDFINCQTKDNQKIPKAKTFDASRYEQFDDEYPPGSGALEYDPKMRATYDAILDGEE